MKCDTNKQTWVLFDPATRDFFYPAEKKLEKLRFLREIFQTQTQTQTIDSLDDPGQKFLIRTHHYCLSSLLWDKAEYT